MIQNSFWLTFLIAISPFALNAHDRSSGSPYISGDTFRHSCDFTYDELSKDIDSSRVDAGSTIFLKTDFLEEFFTKVHPRIRSPYILVTHNSDYPVPGNFSAYLDDEKIIGWFGQNVENSNHPKMHRIPIGIANKMWSHGNVEVFKQMQNHVSDGERSILLYMNFTPETYPKERGRVVELFKDKPFCVVSKPKEMAAYLADLAKTKFVLSPRGNGLDCHRTWEALLMGAIPIVKTSSLDAVYEGLPVVIVNSWDQIDENFLNSKYDEMKSKPFDMERIYFAYWLEKIRALQRPFKKEARAAVTYDLGGGRFGDKLIGYLHAKWISYHFAISLLYQPFPYSEQLVLHETERHYEKADENRFDKTIHPKFGMDIDYQNNVSSLYVIPYFPEARWEHTPKNAWYYFPVDWSDRGFKNEIRKLISPLHVRPDLQLPTDRITVAVHMRLGGGFDAEHTRSEAPLKLPPVSFYKEQIRHIYELLGHKPLYVHIFTDDKDPAKLMKECQEFTQDLNIEYGCRSEGNAHDSNVIKDFFELTKFDCLIRAESNFSIVAAKLSDFLIEISPTHFTWTSQGVGRVDQVFVKYGQETSGRLSR